MKKSVDNSKTFIVFLIDLSKAFDCLPHELIVAKLNAYGFTLSSSRLIHSYFLDRKQSIKINSAHSFWEEILFGVPQRSILGQVLFNIFIFSMFTNIDFTNCTDDIALHVIGDGAKVAIDTLKNVLDELFC